MPGRNGLRNLAPGSCMRNEMYQGNRPTCVTVIGWAWIIIGGLMFLSAVMALLSSVMIGEMAQNDPEMPLIFKLFPLLAIFQIGIAAIGCICGINFLKLKTWSRSVLEVLTWLLLVFILGFMAFWLFNWMSTTMAHGPQGFGIMGAVMGVIITGIYGVPLVIMLKYLRGSKVKSAINGSAEPGASSEPHSSSA